MKLGIISDCVHYKTPDGKIGTENHILLRQFQALCSYFSEALICCPFATYDSSKVISFYTSENIKFTSVPKVGGDTLKSKLKLFATIPTWRRAYKIIDDFSDVVYQRFPNNLNILAFFYFKQKRKKVFATYTGTWKNHAGEPASYKFQRYLLQRFFPGPVWVYAEKPLNSKRLHAGFSPSYSNAEWEDESTQVEKRILAITNEGVPKFRLITVGALIDYKNQLLILRACVVLKEKGFSFSLTIVGDGPMRDELAKFIKGNNLKSEVVMTGKLNAEDLRQLYRQHDFAVQAPLFEGFGKVPVEAFFHGVVPVINNISLAKTIVGNEARGFLFDATNEHNLVDVIYKISDNIQLLPLMIKQGRAYAHSHTLNAWAEEYYKTVKAYFEDEA
jgi:glycosyltransferase involved in cell wall biosynthesis